MAKSYLRGHEIECINGEWRYCDTKEPTIPTYEQRPCGHCGLAQTAEGHDGCLATLPGVMNACCGHGQTRDAYVQFTDGRSIRGNFAIQAMEILKGAK